MSALTVSEVLDKAADLIEPEGRWTQHTFARDQIGEWTEATSPNAVCWCALGAIKAIAGVDGPTTIYGDAANFARSIIAGEQERIDIFNDAYGRKQSEVVAKLREAAALAREQEA